MKMYKQRSHLALRAKFFSQRVVNNLDSNRIIQRVCAQCTLLFKETISYYTRNDSSVYCVLLDATKAFDRISYVKLFRKLIDRKLPAIVIRFLVNSYRKQTMCVQWDSKKSDTFSGYNMALSRPGAILSSNFVCVYIEDTESTENC